MHQQQQQQPHHQQSQPAAQESQQQQHDEQHTHCHAHAHIDHLSQQQQQHQQPQQQQHPTTPHRHKQRKHSHSPHHSRHTSPHSHHSHSLHSSPHHSHDMTRSHSIVAPTSSTHAHHHHHRRRKKSNSHHHHNGTVNASQQERSAASRHNHHNASCARRHRSATDVSSTSINTCHDPTCTDREIHQLLVRKNGASSSRTELAQYFAEDLYGTSRRPSSCCTSSDYCYQTDSTSLYGSRSSLSRNNSIKSASVAMRKRRYQPRPPSYTSISLRGLNASNLNSQLGSLTSIFDRAKQLTAGTSEDEGSKMIVSKATIERQTSKDALSNDLPEYACSPSPIRWSFLADGKSPTDFVGDVKAVGWKSEEQLRDPPRSEHSGRHGRSSQQTQYRRHSRKHDERPSTSAAAAARKHRKSSFEESNTVLFHQEGEPFNNCCSNYIQCNTYLDQDLQITSEDIQQYLSKGNQQVGSVLNNSKNYPFQPSNALEFQYKNNFANNNIPGAASSEGGDSMRATNGYESEMMRFQRITSKETNLNQNASAEPTAACASTCSSITPLSPTNINLSSSTNNINIVFNASLERNANEVKFINTAARDNEVSSEAHHSGYLPFTYPTYDYTNMSANSLFEKPLGIVGLPKAFANQTVAEAAGNGGDGSSSAASDGQHSSLLQSPIQAETSFESFDAASEHNLLSHRDSFHFSPTLCSPRSPRSPASSSLSGGGDGINPVENSYAYTHYAQRYASPPTYQNQRHHHHNHFTESLKFSNAFKRVRKRARKCTDFLRKK